MMGNGDKSVTLKLIRCLSLIFAMMVFKPITTTFDAVSIFLIPKLLANKSMVAVATVMTCVSLKIKQMHYNMEIRILWSFVIEVTRP